jgi:predicted ArsR family transcriptional regulator
MTPGEISIVLKLAPMGLVAYHLENLEKKGYVTSMPAGQGEPWKRYAKTEKS